MRKLLGPVLAFAMTVCVAELSHACPGCKDSIPNAVGADGGPGGPTPGLPVGFNYSVYVMLVGLFSVMAMVGGIIVKGVRGADGIRRPAGFPVSPPPRH